MIDIPKVSLSKLLQLERRSVEVIPDAEYAEIGIYCFGKGIFHKTPRKGFEVGDKSLFLVKEGDFILQITFAWEGAVALASSLDDGMYCSTRFPTFRIDKNQCFPQYLLNYFRTPAGIDQLVKISPGSAGRNRVLSLKRIPEVFVPLPPLDEQRRIVARIEELAAKVEEARGLRRQSAEEAEALFCSGIERVITELSETSENQHLINVVETERGISYGVVLTGTPQLQEHGVPTLRAGNLQKFQIILHNIKYIAPELEAKYQRTRLHGNELLLRIRGGLGEVAVCPSEMIGGNVSREIAVIPFTEKVLPKYGMYVLSAPCNQIKMKAHLRGTSYVGINLKDVRMLSIPLPPLPEQHRIVAYLDNLQSKVDALKRLQAETAAELDALLPSILDKAFKGEL